MSLLEKLRYRYVDAGAVIKDGKKLRKYSRVRRFSAEREREFKIALALLLVLAFAAALIRLAPASSLPQPTNVSPFQ